MTFNIRPIARLFFKTLLGIFSVCFVLFILSAIALQAGLFWLNTEKGGKWLANHIETAMKDQPYQIKLNHFTLAGLFGIRAHRIELQDQDGTFLEAHNFAFRVNPIPLLVKNLSIRLHSDELTLLRAPISNNKNETDTNESPLSIALPDDFFLKNADLSITIQKLALGDDILKGGYQSSFHWDQRIYLNPDDVITKGTISIDDVTANFAEYVPHKIHNALTFDEENQTFVLEKFSLLHDDYRFDATSQYNLSTANIIARIDASWQNVAKFSPDLSKPLSLKMNMEGMVHEFNGDVTLNAAYQDIETSPIIHFSRRQNIFEVTEITGKAGPMILDGNVIHDIDSAKTKGQIRASIPDLEVLKELADTLPNMSGKGEIAINITTPSTSPQIQLQAKLNDTYINGIEITKARIDLQQQGNGYAADIDLRGFQNHPFMIQGQANIPSTSPLKIEIPGIDLGLANGKTTLSGMLNEHDLDMKIKATPLMLATMPFADLSALPLEISSINGSITGALSAPQIDMAYTIKPVNQEPYAVAFTGETTYHGETIKTQAQVKGEGIRSSAISLDIPAQISLLPFAVDISADTALNGLAAIDADLGAITAFILPPIYQFMGDLDMNAQIAGKLASPIISGDAKLRKGSIKTAASSFELNDMSLDSNFSDREITISSLKARGVDGQGVLEASATIDISNAASPDINGQITLDNMHLIDQFYNIILDADMALTTNMMGGYALKGVITPEQAEIILPERFAQTIPTLNIVTEDETLSGTDKAKEQIDLDITLEAPQKIFVKGWGLDAELGGELEVTGTAYEPLINGKLASIRGRYEEFGRTFTLNKTELMFRGTIPPSPYFDIEAATEVDDITAKVLITNNMEDPNITLTAIPSLPEDEVLSLILFGKSIEEISPFQAVQLASTLRRFSGQGGPRLNPLAMLENITGLDDISVEGTGEDMTVGAGKYISDNVYVEVEQGAAAASGAASVEIEVSPSITVESKAGQNGDNRVGAFWEWTY